MIKLTNPDTGETFIVTEERLEELLPEVEYAEDNKLSSIWFLGMRLETSMARKILDGEME